ncbi:hypothetical protein FB446DRAFT_832474, partial [Lentinula raphanica]
NRENRESERGINGEEREQSEERLREGLKENARDGAMNPSANGNSNTMNRMDNSNGHGGGAGENNKTMFAPSSDQAYTRPGMSRGRSGSLETNGNVGNNQGQNQGQTHTHSRTSSFFSFGKHRNQQQPQQPSVSSVGGEMAGRTSLTMSSGPGVPQGQGQIQSQSQAQVQSVGQAPALHPEIRSIVSLTVAHAHKIYFSGPLIRRIEREANGGKPHHTTDNAGNNASNNGWEQVWAQLGGTTLSVWNMREIEEASKRGKEVPPSYLNITDAFVQVLGSVTIPAQNPANAGPQPAQRYTNVLTLNTAGSNLILFACPSTDALISWAAAIRLSAWEKSRLEEMYTAHLCRIMIGVGKADVGSTLVRGKLEGWVRIRVAGRTEWKAVWMVVREGRGAGEGGGGELGRVESNGVGDGGSTVFSKKRMSALFQREKEAGVDERSIAMYLSPKPKDRKKPVLVLPVVSQAFAVYPERPELISRSTLIKIEGMFGQEGEGAGSMRGREGWVLVMPQVEGEEGGLSASGDMLKWIIAIHDAFGLYGRPKGWTWDPRDKKGLMFGYPVGPTKDVSP